MSETDQHHETPTSPSDSSVPKATVLVFTAVIVVAVVILGTAIAFALNREEDTSSGTPATPGTPYVLPQGASEEDGLGIRVGESPTTLAIFEDFQCPACAALQREIGAGIAERVEEGTTSVVLNPMIFLDDKLGNDSSLQATNAMGCAADQSKALDFHSQVFQLQPLQAGEGFTTEQLILAGQQAGIADLTAFTECVANGTYIPWAQAANDLALESGIQSTPTLVFEGETLDLAQIPNIDAFFDLISGTPQP